MGDALRGAEKIILAWPVFLALGIEQERAIELNAGPWRREFTEAHN